MREVRNDHFLCAVRPGHATNFHDLHGVVYASTLLPMLCRDNLLKMQHYRATSHSLEPADMLQRNFVVLPGNDYLVALIYWISSFTRPISVP